TDEAYALEIEVDRGRTRTGSLVGPDGKPVAGATAYGLDYYGPRNAGGAAALTADTFTALGLDPEKPRTPFSVHKERKLIGHVVIKGEDKGPLPVRLQPWGTLTGRLTAAGKPLPNVRVRARHDLPAPGVGPPDSSGWEATTDRDGR